MSDAPLGTSDNNSLFHYLAKQASHHASLTHSCGKTCWCKTQGYDHQPNDAQRMKRPVHQVIATDTTQHTRKPRGKPGDDKTDPLHKRHQFASNSGLRRVIERQQQTERKCAAQT